MNRYFTPAFQVFIAALAIIFLALPPVFAFAVELTKDEQADCAKQGGCALVTKKWVNERIAEAYKAGREYSDVTCGKRTGYPFDDFRD